MSLKQLFKIHCFLIGFFSPAVYAEIVPVGIAPHGGVVVLGGTVIPLKEVTLSAQLAGRIVTIAGDEGDEFNAGAELLRINDDDLQARKQAARAQLGKAHTSMQNAQVQYNRELWSPSVYNPRPMAGMGFPSMFDGMFNGFGGGNRGNKGIDRHADLAAQGSQVEAARAQITEAESGLRGIDAKLRDTRAIAPFDGVCLAQLRAGCLLSGL